MYCRPWSFFLNGMMRRRIMRRSSKALQEGAAERALWWRWSPPDPGAGVTVELSGGDAGGVGDVVGVGQRRTGEGFAPEKAPPALDEVEPGGADRNEGVLDPRVGSEPVPDGTTGAAGQVVGNQVQVAVGRGVVDRLHQTHIAREGARGSGLGQHLPRAHAQRPVHPGLLASAVVGERRLATVAIA